MTQNPEATANFAFEVFAAFAALVAFVLCFFSTWTSYKGETDRWMTVAVYTSTISYAMYSTFSATGDAIYQSALPPGAEHISSYVPFFYFALFIHIFYFLFTVSFFVALPRIIIQQIRQARDDGISKSFSIFTAVAGLVLVLLNGASIVMVQYENWVYVFGGYLFSEEPSYVYYYQSFVERQNQIEFAFYLLWTIYTLSLIGFYSILVQKPSSRLTKILILFIVLPLLLFYNIILVAVTALALDHGSLILFNASAMVEAIVFATAFICLSIIGVKGRSHTRQALQSLQEQQRTNRPHSTASTPSFTPQQIETRAGSWFFIPAQRRSELSSGNSPTETVPELSSGPSLAEKRLELPSVRDPSEVPGVYRWTETLSELPDVHTPRAKRLELRDTYNMADARPELPGDQPTTQQPEPSNKFLSWLC